MSSFRIIKAEERTASMIDWFSGICHSITDFVVGSKIRTKFEALAVEMESQDFAWYLALRKAIPTALYRAFNFELLPSQKASGTVTFTIAAALDYALAIPKGTQVSTGYSTTNVEVVYETAAYASIPIGSTTTNATVSAIYTGQDGNVKSEAINTVLSVFEGIEISVSNAAAITGGSGRETEGERRLRFTEYIATISRGTLKAVEYGAKTSVVRDVSGVIIETVHDAIIYEPFMHDETKPVGVFECYVYNGYGDTSDDLVEEVQKAVDGYTNDDGTVVVGWKAAGVVCNVIKATETIMNVVANIVTLPGFNSDAVEAEAIDTADIYISGLGIGKQFVYNEFVSRLMDINGVYNVTVTSPAEDYHPVFHEVCNPGTKTVTVTSL